MHSTEFRFAGVHERAHEENQARSPLRAEDVNHCSHTRCTAERGQQGHKIVFAELDISAGEVQMVLNKNVETVIAAYQ